MGHDPYADQRDEEKSRKAKKNRERRSVVVRLSTELAEVNAQIDELKLRKKQLENDLDHEMDTK